MLIHHAPVAVLATAMLLSAAIASAQPESEFKKRFNPDAARGLNADQAQCLDRWYGTALRRLPQHSVLLQATVQSTAKVPPDSKLPVTMSVRVDALIPFVPSVLAPSDSTVVAQLPIDTTLRGRVLQIQWQPEVAIPSKAWRPTPAPSEGTQILVPIGQILGQGSVQQGTDLGFEVPAPSAWFTMSGGNFALRCRGNMVFHNAGAPIKPDEIHTLHIPIEQFLPNLAKRHAIERSLWPLTYPQSPSFYALLGQGNTLFNLAAIPLRERAKIHIASIQDPAVAQLKRDWRASPDEMVAHWHELARLMDLRYKGQPLTVAMVGLNDDLRAHGNPLPVWLANSPEVFPWTQPLKPQNFAEFGRDSVSFLNQKHSNPYTEMTRTLRLSDDWILICRFERDRGQEGRQLLLGCAALPSLLKLEGGYPTYYASGELAYQMSHTPWPAVPRTHPDAHGGQTTEVRQYYPNGTLRFESIDQRGKDLGTAIRYFYPNGALQYLEQHAADSDRTGPRKTHTLYDEQGVVLDKLIVK